LRLGLLVALTYIVDFGELQFVLFFVVEDGAVLIDEAHDGGLPARRAQEPYDHVEEPVLKP